MAQRLVVISGNTAGVRHRSRGVGRAGTDRQDPAAVRPRYAIEARLSHKVIIAAAERVDVLAMALWDDVTAQNLLKTDLSYVPPLAPPGDLVLKTTRETWQRRDDRNTGATTAADAQDGRR